MNTISLASIAPLAGSSVYSATKFGLRGFNIALHMEMKPRGITVSGVLPGAIDTPMLLKETREGATALNFLGDPLPPEKVAKVILRAAREGKLEYYVPYSERILSSFALFFPALIPTIYPWFEKMGRQAQEGLSRKPRQRYAAGRHADPGARTGGGLVETRLLTWPAGSPFEGSGVSSCSAPGVGETTGYSLMLGLDTVESVAHVIQVALTPVFLLSGIASLLGVLSTRLARVADRVDALAEQLEADGPVDRRNRSEGSPTSGEGPRCSTPP